MASNDVRFGRGSNCEKGKIKLPPIDSQKMIKNLDDFAPLLLPLLCGDRNEVATLPAHGTKIGPCKKKCTYN